MKEYVIWGIAPKLKEETLLLTKFNDEVITDRVKAERLKSILEDRGCVNVRVQELDFSGDINSSFIGALVDQIFAPYLEPL